MGVFVAQTARFQIEVDANLGSTGFQVAQALAQICEADYQRCVQWFGGIQVPYRSPDTPGFIRVLLTTLGGGWNNGSGGFIKVNAFSDVESVGLVFVAELAELFMLAQNSGWDPSNSKGEALSRLLGEEAHPTAPAEGLFFTAQSWLGTDADPYGSAQRHDWVTSNEATDTNFVSTGCAILFLNYLRWQLGYPLDTIIATPGATLETIYQTLTATSGGFQPFSTLLNRFFPIGTKPAVSDNPFPLLDAAQRHVFLSAQSTPTGARIVRTGVTEARFLGCPPKQYRYDIVATSDRITAAATPVGFGIARFAWTVNGAVAANGATIQPTAMVFRPDPSLAGGGTASIEPLPLTITAPGNGATLMLSSAAAAFAGQANLTIAVTVTDTFDTPGAAVLAAAGANIATEVVVYEPSYHQDAAHCADAFINRWRKVAPPFDHLAQAIAIILTLPDPPPPDFQRALLILEEISSLSQRLRTALPSEAREQLQHFLARKLTVAPTLAARIEGGR